MTLVKEPLDKSINVLGKNLDQSQYKLVGKELKINITMQYRMSGSFIQLKEFHWIAAMTESS